MNSITRPEPRRAQRSQGIAPPMHPEAMTVGPEGVPGCFWPLHPREIGAARDRFFAELYAWIRDRDVDRDREAELVWLNAAPIAMEVMRLYNGLVVVERLRAAGRLPTFGDEAGDDALGLFARLAAAGTPEPSRLARATLRGLAPDPLWRKALRTAKYAVGGGPIRYRPRPLIRPARDIVTFTVDPLTSAHAERSARPVVLSKFDEWLGTGDLADRVAGQGVGADAREAVLALARRLFARAGAPLTPALEAHLGDFLDRFTTRTRIHLRELRRLEKRLPREFWPSTGGILYNRVFSRAVQLAGGTVTGHDHSSSSGWWAAPERTAIELNTVDRFVTYGESIAEGLRRDLDPALLARPDRPPEIVALSTGRPAPPTAPASRGAAAPAGRRLMYVMNLYAGDTMTLWPTMPDLVAVDWQARLLDHLRGAGYQVRIKPHPASHCAPPAAFTEALGSELASGPCETVMPEADILLFDYPGATCLLHALRGSQPIVLIDFPHLRLVPEARALLARRVALLPGELDAEGRASVDWGDLDRTLASAESRLDRGFVDTYFPAL